MPETADEKFVVTAEQYEYLAAPLPALPTPGELFDFEVETLVGHKLATYADADAFRNRSLGRGLFLFVPAPPEMLALENLMSLVELDGERGVNFVFPHYIESAAESLPSTASLLTDIDDGRNRLDIDSMTSRKNIARQGRHPYGVWRGIIHAILFPMVLRHHQMDLVGARPAKNHEIVLSVGHNNKPQLNQFHGCGFAHRERGAPSAREVLSS